MKSGQPGLWELMSTSPDLQGLFYYHYYRLEYLPLKRTPCGTGKVHKCMKRMQLSLWNQYFIAEDPVSILDCFSRFRAETDIPGTNENKPIWL